MDNSVATQSLTQYVESHASQSQEWINDIRRAALKRFTQVQWPSQNEEEWRRTDIQAYALDSYAPSMAATTISKEDQESLQAHGGVAISLAALAAKEHPANLSPHVVAQITEGTHAVLHQRLKMAENRFQLWNLALLNDGWVIWLPPKCTPAQHITITTHAKNDTEGVIAPHVIVLAHQQSSIHCTHVLPQDTNTLLLPDCSISVGPAAQVHYINYTIANLDSIVVANGFAQVERDARFQHIQLLFGGMCAKARFDAALRGEGASAYLDGAYFGHEDQHVDVRTTQYHQAPNTSSFALYLGAAADESHTIYQGMIQVAHEAVGTDAYLTNNNLILSDEARSDSIPGLNISTDEVKCSHGSTTGTIDEVQRYYLQCRGFSAQEASSYIVAGFFNQVVSKVPEALHPEVMQRIESRIPPESAANSF